MPSEIPQPWLAFLRDLDDAVDGPVEFHCLGGFVVSLRFGMPRPTGDIDLICIRPSTKTEALLSLAGKGSILHGKHKVYLDFVTLRVQPENYEKRLTEMFPGTFRKIRLMAVDPYDLVLSKLDRQSPKDRADFLYLGESVPLDFAILRSRYESEVAPYLFDAADRSMRLTLDFWIESAEEIRSREAKDARGR